MGNFVSEIENAAHTIITIKIAETFYTIELEKNTNLIHAELQQYKYLEDCIFVGKVIQPTAGTASMSNCDGEGYVSIKCISLKRFIYKFHKITISLIRQEWY